MTDKRMKYLGYYLFFLSQEGVKPEDVVDRVIADINAMVSDKNLLKQIVLEMTL